MVNVMSNQLFKIFKSILKVRNTSGRKQTIFFLFSNHCLNDILNNKKIGRYLKMLIVIIDVIVNDYCGDKEYSGGNKL